MAISYSLNMPKLGSASPSSLVKSAATITNEVHTYEDTIQKINFENNPTDQNFSAYTKYLQDRISALQSSGTITDLTKAATMTQQINTAYKTNTSFNIDQITTQMLAGNATDQNKLEFLTTNVLQNPIVQADPSMYSKYMNQAYGLQQSIQYEAQASATASQVAYTAEQAATKQGYTNTVDALTSSWKTITDTFKNGGAGEVNQALKDFTAKQAPVFKALGIDLPTGSQLTMAGVAQAVLHAQASYYENGAVALGTTTPDGQAFMQKAQDITNGVSSIDTPAGSMNIFEVNKWAAAPTNLYRSTTDANGQTKLTENAVSGYTVKNGQVLPETTGANLSTFSSLDKNTQSDLKGKLQGMGLNVLSTSGQGVTVQLTNQSSKWMGMRNSDLLPGDEVTLISTDSGKGFQLVSNSGKVYGISLDERGLAGLYSANQNGNYSMVAGQYGFNPQTTVGAQRQQAINTANVQQVQAAGSIFGGTPFAMASKAPKMTQRAGGGYNFTNANGQAISAATYAMLTGTSFRGLLQTMANTGDAGAKQTLGFVGNDFKYDPTKISAGNNSSVYNAMTWGAEPAARTSTPNLTMPSGFRL